MIIFKLKVLDLGCINRHKRVQTVNSVEDQHGLQQVFVHTAANC